MPLLALVMIVKNEAKSIPAIFDSVRAFVDTYVILDTGSTDGTVARIAEAAGDLSGHVFHEPFVDYATTRNRVLALAEPYATFGLLLSGDETLASGGEALRSHLLAHESESAPAHGAYLTTLQFGQRATFASPRVVRLAARWRYHGAVHEVLLSPTGERPSLRIPVTVFHDADGRDHERKKHGWRTIDLPLLEAAIAKDPNDARSMFYYAQTLHDLGMLREALAAYDERIALAGWHEEIYQSMFRKARILQALRSPWPYVQQAYLDAHALARHRAEPLIEIAAHWSNQRNHPLAFLFAQRAAALPYPEGDLLNVDAYGYNCRRHDLLGIAAYYVGEYAIGERAVRKALEHSPRAEHLLKNLAFYVDRKKTE